MTSAPPPRRLPSRVYRRRRAGVLLALLVIMVALIVILVQARTNGGAAGAGATPSGLPTIYPTSDPGATGGAGAGATGTATPAGPCAAGAVTVTANTSASRYAPDATPELSLSVTNTGGADCAMNAGTSKQVFTITSGSDTIWRSTDCQTGAADLAVVLPAGETVSGSGVAWDRTRSSPETCSGGRESVGADGASYSLTVSVDGIDSAPTQFVLE